MAKQEKMTFVTVVGAMRSGTAGVAEILHMMGCPMASWIVAPQPPSWRSDWEDADFNRAVFSKIPFGSSKTLDYLPQIHVNNLFGRYLEARRLTHKALIGGRSNYGIMEKTIGVKHPFLLFILNHWCRTLMLNDFSPVLICTNRDREEIDRSSEHTIFLKKGGRETQEALLGLIRSYKYDYVVDYTEMQDDPERVVRCLAKAIGQDDEEAIQRGIASVRRPSWYNNKAQAIGG